MHTIVEFNVETGEIIEREMTNAELKQVELDKTQRQTELQIKAEAETKREALLARLGITEEEAKLLLL